jgi:hypothetical protein
MFSSSISAIELSEIDFKTSETPPDTDSAQSSKIGDAEKVIEIVESGETHPTIPRADGGKHAWLFLVGRFVFEALIWVSRFPRTAPLMFTNFRSSRAFPSPSASFYTTHPPFSNQANGDDDHPNSIAVIGTCSSGIMYLFAPISLYALETWPSIRRLSSIVGLAIVVTALMASSFSSKVWHLILTQGVLYTIGGSLLYSPTMFYLDEWFIKKKGLAIGIMWAGVGT